MSIASASDRSGHNSVTEMEKRIAALSDTDIRGVLSYICDRNVATIIIVETK